MKKHCEAFLMRDPEDALCHIRENWEPVTSYGDLAYGHWLHTWDEGSRTLGRCSVCGGYILWQCSEYHSFTSDDSYYSDYFPVAGPKEADALNRAYDGYSLERDYPGRYLLVTNGHAAWSGDLEEDGGDEDAEDPGED